MKVDNLTSYCGLVCGSCPIYLATREIDKEKKEEMRFQIAEFASKQYDITIRPKDVMDCDGCKATSGRLFSGCFKCDIRKCAQEKGCLTCAHCSDYPCDRLQKFFVSEPIAKKNLDNIRRGT